MKAIGIILAGGNNKLMKDLSKKRAIVGIAMRRFPAPGRARRARHGPGANHVVDAVHDPSD